MMRVKGFTPTPHCYSIVGDIPNKWGGGKFICGMDFSSVMYTQPFITLAKASLLFYHIPLKTPQFDSLRPDIPE